MRLYKLAGPPEDHLSRRFTQSVCPYRLLCVRLCGAGCKRQTCIRERTAQLLHSFCDKSNRSPNTVGVLFHFRIVVTLQDFLGFYLLRRTGTMEQSRQCTQTHGRICDWGGCTRVCNKYTMSASQVEWKAERKRKGGKTWRGLSTLLSWRIPAREGWQSILADLVNIAEECPLDSPPRRPFVHRRQM